MKKRAMLWGLCLLLLLQLVGCDNSASAPGSAEGGGSAALRVAPEDRNQAFLLQSFVESPEGYFYGREMPVANGLGGLIYFCPRGASDFYPLCSKPNCRHQDSNCNAYYGGLNFGYYKGALYTTETKFEGMGFQLQVIKMNLDGTDHSVVSELDVTDFGSYHAVFHHGKLYVLGNANQELPLDEQEDRLIVLDLEDYSQTEPAAEALHTMFLPDFNIFYQDKLYGYGTTDRTRNYKAKDVQLIELDVATGSLRPLTQSYTNSCYVTDSTLYYLEADWRAITEHVLKRLVDNPVEISDYMDSLFEGFTQPEIGFREYDFASGTVKNCGMPVKNPSQAFYDEDYIYLYALTEEGQEMKTLHFLSRAYEPLDQLKLPIELSLAAVTSDRLFFCSSTDQTITQYLDRSQIGSHHLELQPVETH